MFSCFKRTSKTSYNVSTTADLTSSEPPPPRRPTQPIKKFPPPIPTQNGNVPSATPVVGQPEKKTQAPPTQVVTAPPQKSKPIDDKPNVAENRNIEDENPRPPVLNETLVTEPKPTKQIKSSEIVPNPKSNGVAVENTQHQAKEVAVSFEEKPNFENEPKIENRNAVEKNQQSEEINENEIAAMSQPPTTTPKNELENHNSVEISTENKRQPPVEIAAKNETASVISSAIVVQNGDVDDGENKPKEKVKSARYRAPTIPDDSKPENPAPIHKTETASVAVAEVKVKKTVTIEPQEVVIVSVDDDSESEPETSKPKSKPNPPDGEVEAAKVPEERRGGVRQTAKIDTEQEIKSYPKNDEEIGQIKRAILANEFLENVLKGDTLNTIIGAMYLREVEAGEVIIEEGEDGDHMYVSSEGKYEVLIQNKLENIITGNRVFGELAILYNAKRMATIKAATKGHIWVLPREIYQQTLIAGAIKDQEETLSFLQNVPLINSLKKEKLLKIANILRKEFFKTDSVIIREGDRGDKFYIIRAGSVTVTKHDEGKVAELGRGSFFGERALRQEDRRQATVIADAPGVECLTLSRSEFQEHFDDSIWKNDDASRKESAKKSRPKIELKPTTEYSDVNLSDLKRVETLGVGGFGRVELVQHKENAKLTFALKYLKKIDMIQQGQVDHVFSEKEIQISCESVFIVRMYKTFKDQKYLYFLMESCLGGDLWTYLQKQKDRHVNEVSGRFFAACVLEALSYLHDRDCVYRDLKPENLLLDVNGYLKLTDFGFAKHIGHRGKAYTFAGTPEYVAPEIIYNRGHDKSVDYWAFGIFIFELLVGKTPFRSDDPSHMKTYNRILRGINGVNFPQHVSKSATSIIQKLCKAAPTERLGAHKNGVQDIRNHRWFQGFDWNKLRTRKIKAPYIPKLTSNVDTKYFEKFKKDDDVPPDEISGFDSTF